MRQRLKNDAIEKHPDGRVDQKRQRNVDRNRRMTAGQPRGEDENQRWDDDVDQQGPGHQTQMECLAAGEQIQGERNYAQRERQQGGARHLA